MIGRPGTLEIIIILFAVLLLFGAKRIPDIARSLGESLHIFKKSLKDGLDSTEEDEKEADKPVSEEEE